MDWNRPEIAIPQDLKEALDEIRLSSPGTESLSDINIGSGTETKSITENEAETGLAGNEPETENTDPINTPEPNEELVGLLKPDILEPDPEPINDNIQVNTIDIPVDRSDVLRRREAPDLPKYPGEDNTPIILSSPEPEPHLPPNSPWAVCSPPASETRTDRFLFRLMVEPSRRWTITTINTDTAERKNHASGSGGIPAMSGQIYTGLEFARLRGVV